MTKEFFSIKSVKVQNLDQMKSIIEKGIAKDITELLSAILASSVDLGASDIHIEPGQEKIKIRLRIDGLLHDVILIEKNLYKALLSRIKLISGLKLNITNKSQDGRFTLKVAEQEIEVRISSLPSEYGESIVMRILNPKNLMTLEGLGLRKDILDIFTKEITRPNGMIIVTGPTGSGKTTTLYAILKKIQKPEIKIITIEDPIEYHLDDISQSQVNPAKGYTFATGLETIVRQDPDVILVGEIRDKETASISLQASLTGHLVLTTLHTNDATGTILRLQALGETLTNIAPAINLAIAQRLVRKTCKCSIARKPTTEELALLKNKLQGLKTPKIEKITEPKGCAECNFTGYKGRIGIYEFFLVDSKMETFLAKSPSLAELKTKAKEEGMITLEQDGYMRVIEGITTIEEIKRVAGS